MLELLTGRRRQSAVVNIPTALIANSVVVLTLSTFAGMVGAKTFKLKRLKIRNNNAGNTWVHIGTGMGAGAFVDRIPALWSISNSTDDYQEGDLPAIEVLATITAYVGAVGAGSFDVQVEVEEIG